MSISWLLFIGLSYFALILLITAVASRKKVGRLRVFLISIFLTPLAGLFVYKLSEPAYLINLVRYRCHRCGVDFTEPLNECPYCKREGVKTNLSPVKINCI